MGHRIFVKVVGFSGAERHALNAVFRLSEGGDLVFSLWLPDAPELPSLLLIDGQHPDATLEHSADTGPHQPPLFWVGAIAPAHATRAFVRPVQWRAVVEAMNQLFGRSDAPDIDHSLDFADTHPSMIDAPVQADKWALVACASLNERLYFRAKLAINGFLHVDEVATGAELLNQIKGKTYHLIVLDMQLPDMDGWTLLQEISPIAGKPPHVIAIVNKATMGVRMKARSYGAAACIGMPLDPPRLHVILQLLQ